VQLNLIEFWNKITIAKENLQYRKIKVTAHSNIFTIVKGIISSKNT